MKNGLSQRGRLEQCYCICGASMCTCYVSINRSEVAISPVPGRLILPLLCRHILLTGISTEPVKPASDPREPLSHVRDSDNK